MQKFLLSALALLGALASTEAEGYCPAPCPPPACCPPSYTVSQTYYEPAPPYCQPPSCYQPSVCCPAPAYCQPASYCQPACPPPSCCKTTVCCTPLWSLKVKGGVAPSFYTQRKRGLLNFPSVGFLVPARAKKAEFCNQFNLPWIAGGEIGFLLSCSTELFLDGDYTRAKGKSFKYHGYTPFGEYRIREKYDDLKQASAYLGLRQYFRNLFNGCLDLYFGVKAGFQHRDAIRHRVKVPGEPSHSSPYYKNVNTVAGGVQLGLAYYFCKSWSIDFQVEGLYAGPMRAAVDSFNPPAGGFLSNVVIGETGAILSIPCTIGIRGTW